MATCPFHVDVHFRHLTWTLVGDPITENVTVKIKSKFNIDNASASSLDSTRMLKA